MVDTFGARSRLKGANVTFVRSRRTNVTLAPKELADGFGFGAANGQPGDLVVGHIDHDLVPIANLTGQQLAGELIPDSRLHQAAQRPGTVQRVETVHRQPVPGALG